MTVIRDRRRRMCEESAWGNGAGLVDVVLVKTHGFGFFVWERKTIALSFSQRFNFENPKLLS